MSIILCQKCLWKHKPANEDNILTNDGKRDSAASEAGRTPKPQETRPLRSKSFGLTQEGVKGLVGPSGCVIRTVIMFELNGTLSAKKVL